MKVATLPSRRYVGTGKREDGTALVRAFISLEYDPGNAFQVFADEKLKLLPLPVSPFVRLLRNGAPFRQWELPESICEVRTLLEVRPGGDRLRGVLVFSSICPANDNNSVDGKPSAPIHLPPLVADPDDTKYLECAVEGKADYLVSGDHHLLDLKSYQGIRVVGPVTFLHIYRER